MQPMMMPQPQKQTWEQFVEQLEIQIANAEKSLIMAKAQLEEAKKHLKDVEE